MIVRTSWLDYQESEFRSLAQALSRIMMRHRWCSYTTWRVL